MFKNCLLAKSRVGTVLWKKMYWKPMERQMRWLFEAIFNFSWIKFISRITKQSDLELLVFDLDLGENQKKTLDLYCIWFWSMYSSSYHHKKLWPCWRPFNLQNPTFEYLPNFTIIYRSGLSKLQERTFKFAESFLNTFFWIPSDHLIIEQNFRNF